MGELADQDTEHVPRSLSVAATMVDGPVSRPVSRTPSLTFIHSEKQPRHIQGPSTTGGQNTAQTETEIDIDADTDADTEADTDADTHTATDKNTQTWPMWWGYIALFAGMCQQVLCWGMIMAFGTILSYYSKHLMPGVSMKELSLIGAIPPFCLLALALLWGRLLDAGHHRILNTIAGFCVTGGFIATAFTGGKGRVGDGKYWQILLAVIPVGIGQSIYFLAAPHMAKTWFPKHKGFSMGITNSGAAVGGALFPIAFTKMIEHHSFKAAVGVFAAVSGVLAIFITWAAVPAPRFIPREIGKKSSVTTWWPKRAFMSWTFRVLTIAMCFVYLGTLTVPFYIELWAQKRHLGVSEDVPEKKHDLTVYLVVILNSCQLPGRWLGSTMCDYTKARKVHCAATVANAILIYVGWMCCRSFASAAVFAGLFGFLLGTMVSLPVNNVQEVLGHRIQLFGQYSGAMYTCAAPFMLCGAVAAGAMVDSLSNGIAAAGLWAASVFMLGGLLVFVSLLIPNDTYKFDEPKSAVSSIWAPEDSTVPVQQVTGVQTVQVGGRQSCPV